MIIPQKAAFVNFFRIKDEFFVGGFDKIRLAERSKTEEWSKPKARGITKGSMNGYRKPFLGQMNCSECRNATKGRGFVRTYCAARSFVGFSSIV